MRYLFTVLAALMLITGVQAADNGNIRMGDQLFKRFDFKNAVLFYAKAYKKDSTNSYLKQRLADSYRLMNDWQQAEPWYKLLSMEGNATSENKMYYADALRANEKYGEAKVAYREYLRSTPSDVYAKSKLEGLEDLEKLRKDRGIYSIENLNAINSKASDFGPCIYKDGSLIFSSNRLADAYVRRSDEWTQTTFLQLYEAKSDVNRNFSAPTLIDKKNPNKRYHEGTSSWNSSLSELYFDRSNYNGSKVGFSDDKTVKLKIYKLSYLADKGDWNNKVYEAVGFNSNSYSVAHPTISKDGKTMYFASDMPGGFGGTDIYKVERDQPTSAWGTPENLGSDINSAGEEKFPFLADDGILYYASDSRNGLGGLDIYSASRSGSKWSKPENLGYPVNTNWDDFNYVIAEDNKNGYFVSNRPGGVGDDDIYRFVRKGISLKVIVYDAKTNENVKEAKVVLSENREERANKLTANDGDALFAVQPFKKYGLVASKDGYVPGKAEIETENKSTVVKIPLFKEGGINLEVTVLDKKTRDPLNLADVKLINMTTNKEVPTQTNAEGKTFYELEPSTNYRIEAKKDLNDPNTKYLTVSTNVSSKGKEAPSTLYATLELEKVSKGVAIKIENIYYDLDKWFIRPDAAKELDKIVKVMQDNPTLEIELSSHTDCRATIKYNQELSAKRAKSAVEYIASRGVSISRMISAGYGESRLVNNCACEGGVKSTCTETQHQENRRTEFKILKF